MHLVLALAAVLVVAFAPRPAEAQPAPVVVELFTSQGCASCPPADVLLAELGKVPGVVALALHVDYWDYLGWKDAFASPAFTNRQKGYAKARRDRRIFTPQMVVQGEDMVIGHDAAAIVARIAAHQARPAPVQLDVVRDERGLDILLSPVNGPVGPADVHVVDMLPDQSIEIEGGENAGHVLTYSNIVADWHTIARWDGREPVAIRHEDADLGEVAVIVQAPRQGPVLAAARSP